MASAARAAAATNDRSDAAGETEAGGYAGRRIDAA
jgi:hypothetical protein